MFLVHLSVRISNWETPIVMRCDPIPDNSAADNAHIQGNTFCLRPVRLIKAYDILIPF